MEFETLVLWLAVISYVVAGCVAVIGFLLGKRPERAVLGLLGAGLMLHTWALGLRWERVGHGPFNTLFEILSSNIWSLTLIFTAAYWRIPLIRPTAAFVLPILFIMTGWMMLASPVDKELAPTFDTIWLFIHIGLGKIFLGSVIVAVGIAVTILLRRFGIGVSRLARLPDNQSLDELAFRFMAIGLVFDTLMLVAGAIWAQKAWGRYWAWDPLETWSLLTWLLLAFSLHLRFTLKPAHHVSALLIMGVFVVAFLTFFGIPFVSQSPHQGTF